MRGKKKNHWSGKLSNFFLLAVFALSAYKLTSLLWDYYENRKVLADAQALYSVTSSENNREQSDEVQAGFTDLISINSDIVGWIEIGDTQVNYPILQAEDNRYYLNRNYLKGESRAGSIFMDYRNNCQYLSPNTVVYGHRMKDGSMFAGLKKYLNQSFYEDNPAFLFDTLYTSYEIEVFSAYRTTAEFNYIQTSFEDIMDYASFLEKLVVKSEIKTDVSLSIDDHILTLSTCDHSSSNGNGRLVLHGKMVER